MNLNEQSYLLDVSGFGDLASDEEGDLFSNSTASDSQPTAAAESPTPSFPQQSAEPQFLSTAAATTAAPLYGLAPAEAGSGATATFGNLPFSKRLFSTDFLNDSEEDAMQSERPNETLPDQPATPSLHGLVRSDSEDEDIDLVGDVSEDDDDDEKINNPLNNSDEIIHSSHSRNSHTHSFHSHNSHSQNSHSHNSHSHNPHSHNSHSHYQHDVIITPLQPTKQRHSLHNESNESFPLESPELARSSHPEPAKVANLHFGQSPEFDLDKFAGPVSAAQGPSTLTSLLSFSPYKDLSLPKVSALASNKESTLSKAAFHSTNTTTAGSNRSSINKSGVAEERMSRAQWDEEKRYLKAEFEEEKRRLKVEFEEERNRLMQASNEERKVSQQLRQELQKAQTTLHEERKKHQKALERATEKLNVAQEQKIQVEKQLEGIKQISKEAVENSRLTVREFEEQLDFKDQRLKEQIAAHEELKQETQTLKTNLKLVESNRKKLRTECEKKLREGGLVNEKLQSQVEFLQKELEIVKRQLMASGTNNSGKENPEQAFRCFETSSSSAPRLTRSASSSAATARSSSRGSDPQNEQATTSTRTSQSQSPQKKSVCRQTRMMLLSSVNN